MQWAHGSLAGWNDQKVIAGPPGVLNLQRQPTWIWPEASDIVTDTMTLFGIAADRSSLKQLTLFGFMRKLTAIRRSKHWARL